MLVCIVCGKTIANVDPNTVRYGGCSACPIKEVARLMEEKKMNERGNFTKTPTVSVEQAECCGEMVDADKECPFCGKVVPAINEEGGKE